MNEDIKNLEAIYQTPLNSSGPSGPGGPGPIGVNGKVLDRPLNQGGPGGPDTVDSECPPVPGYHIKADGVFEVPVDESQPAIRLTLAPCGVLGHCRDGRQQSWGAFIRWVDRDGQAHEQAFPVGRFHEIGGSLPGELANAGLPIMPGMEKKLLRYFANSAPKRRYRAAIQTGWQEEAPVFVLPHQSYGGGSSEERYVFQPERYAPTSQSIRQAGTLEQWKANVAAVCADNPLLVFSICCALAAPLLHRFRLEGGGFHLFGATSRGKTTALQVAASVWGDASDPARGSGTTYVKKWNVTKNATEGLAEAHNDLLLCLDEVGEADAQDFGRTIYQLAGGHGKARMRADATLKPPKGWRVLLLSTGEISSAQLVESQGRHAKGGQAVRLIDLATTDPLTGEGIVRNVHGESDPAQFIDQLKLNCSGSFGTAGPALLHSLIEQHDKPGEADLFASYHETCQSLTPQGASQEFARIVKRFGAVAVAGEYARIAGILPWDNGEAVRSVHYVLDRYSHIRGGVGSDTERALDTIRDFLLAHGSSRFMNLQATSDHRVMNLAGYKDEEYFYLTNATFKEATGGHDITEVARLLQKRGLLDTPDLHHMTRRVTVPGTTARVRTYAISTSILGTEASTGPLDRSTISAGPVEKCTILHD